MLVVLGAKHLLHNPGILLLLTHILLLDGLLHPVLVVHGRRTLALLLIAAPERPTLSLPLLVLLLRLLHIVIVVATRMGEVVVPQDVRVIILDLHVLLLLLLRKLLRVLLVLLLIIVIVCGLLGVKDIGD